MSGAPHPSLPDALARARDVFLAGNGLPGRWRGRKCFTIVETGFGLGVNFLATWHAWRQDPERCERLHYVAIEKDPFSAEDLRAFHAGWTEFQPELAELHAVWPPRVAGGHRAELDSGRVVLTLFFADIKVTRELRLSADAFFLDGFAPARDPDMWSPALARSLARLAAPEATAATWSTAGGVRGALESAGFALESTAGKHEMLRATYRGRANGTTSPPLRKATVVGAGVAGAAICERLCARGWEVTLLERHAAPAEGTSGNHAGTFHPLVTPDDSVFARLTRAAFLASLSRWRRLPALRWDPCGVLQLARNERESDSQRRSVASLALPPQYAQHVTREAAGAHAGVSVAADGVWFPEGGWVQPRSLVSALLAACGERLTLLAGQEVERIDPQALTILATAGDALHPVPHARLRRVRGQVTYLPAERIDAPHVVVLRGGFVLPAVEAICVVGASFDLEDDDPTVRASSHAGNLERLRAVLPEANLNRETNLEGRVAFRTVAPDRLPLIGKLADNLYCALAFGSRGLIWSSLAAEMLASELSGEPLPLEGKLADALAPDRFRRRAESRGWLR